MGQRDDATDIAYLIVAAVGLVAVERLWMTRVKPWLGQYVHLDAGEGDLVLTLGALHWTTTDLVGIAVLALLVGVVGALVRAAVRRRKDDQHDRHDRQPVAAGAPGDREPDDEEW